MHVAAKIALPHKCIHYTTSYCI